MKRIEEELLKAWQLTNQQWNDEISQKYAKEFILPMCEILEALDKNFTILETELLRTLKETENIRKSIM